MFKFLKANSSAIFFGFLILMFISLPLSRFGLSVAQFGLLGIWLIDGKLRQKTTLLFRNKAALVLVSFYILHVVGLMYTSDFEYAFKDLRVKLPILFLPIVLATSTSLESKKINLLLLLYVAAVITASLVSFGILITREIANFRDLSPFISHIRLSLNVCLAVFFTGYLVGFPFKTNKYAKYIGTFVIVWLILFLVMIESVTGIIILLITLFVFLIVAAIKTKNLFQRITSISILIILPVLLGFYLNNTIRSYFLADKIELTNLEQLTSSGNPYIHDTLHQPVENGSYTWVNVCEPELRKSWNQQSQLDYDGKDEKNQDLKYTLIRYMNSRGLKKDAEGMEQLTDMDIRYVEMGIANHYYTRKLSIKSRLYKLFWEYQINKMNGNPGGHSTLQRIEFWKASALIIQKNFWIGVGTGDIDMAFRKHYENSGSDLAPKWRHRAHNQFLAVFVSFGLLGLVWFLISLIYPAIILRKFKRFKYLAFWIIIMISMLVEDTLETQMGVTLFAFFNAFLLFTPEEE